MIKKRDLLKESGLTYDDYASIDDGNRYELAGGKLELMSPSPSTNHQIISMELLNVFLQRCKKEYMIFSAPIDIILSANEVRQPDIVLIHNSRISIISNRGIEGAPDLVIEILSPSSFKRDKVDKRKTFAYYEIPEYWIVDPLSGVLEVYGLNEKRYEILNIFQNNEVVSSLNIPCISFTMTDIMENMMMFNDDE